MLTVFECDAFLPPHVLVPTTVESRGVLVLENGTEAVPVRLEVKRRDIWAVAEFVNGVQRDLFLDAEVLATRKDAFDQERAIWIGASGRAH